MILCHISPQRHCGEAPHFPRIQTPTYKVLLLIPFSFPFALVNMIIAVLCTCGLHVNTVAVKGHHAPSKDDGSLKWALSVAAIFHLTGPTHEGGLVAPSSWARLVTGGWGEGDEWLDKMESELMADKIGTYASLHYPLLCPSMPRCGFGSLAVLQTPDFLASEYKSTSLRVYPAPQKPCLHFSVSSTLPESHQQLAKLFRHE